jgi:hypothetical protein
VYSVDFYMFSICLFLESRGSSVGIVTGYGLDGRGSEVRFPAGLVIFLFSTAFIPNLT